MRPSDCSHVQDRLHARSAGVRDQPGSCQSSADGGGCAVIAQCLPSRAQNFIQDIRACSNKEQEEVRIQKELGKIRLKFADDSNLSGEAWGRTSVLGRPNRALELIAHLGPPANLSCSL